MTYRLARLLPLQRGQPRIGLAFEVLLVLGVDEHVEAVEDVAPHGAHARLVGGGLGPHRVHGGQIDDEFRASEGEADDEEHGRDHQRAQAAAHGEPAQKRIHRHPRSALRRRHRREDVREHEVHEQVREQDAERREQPDLPEHAKAGQAQGQE